MVGESTYHQAAAVLRAGAPSYFRDTASALLWYRASASSVAEERITPRSPLKLTLPSAALTLEAPAFCSTCTATGARSGFFSLTLTVTCLPATVLMLSRTPGIKYDEPLESSLNTLSAYCRPVRWLPLSSRIMGVSSTPKSTRNEMSRKLPRKKGPFSWISIIRPPL